MIWYLQNRLCKDNRFKERVSSKEVMPSKTHLGIVPDKLFKTRSKIFNFFSWHICKGICPLNVLDRNSRIIKYCKFSLINSYTSPDNFLLARPRTLKAMQFFNDEVTSPEKLLLSNRRVFKFIKWPIELGICPERLLLA